MKKNAQKKEIKKLKKEKKELEKSFNPFNKNFSLNNKEKVLKEIALINEKIINLKQKLLVDYEEDLDEIENGNLEFNFNLQQLNNEDEYLKDSTFLITNDDINSINSEELINMQYGKKCCPPCTIF
ncbi:hypothetical protein [Spiroplasma endosymbiont of Danaus chrysippus]|uniref:hypothetical protein n=1 Tax=Spiroplasma endosymbiont of Danaus chrysippus TaxID=2691041 RepID=UPI00157A9DEA|nr:hypothetical protein [Spiroplasma endosymbiont of Danaus chrysippus]